MNSLPPYVNRFLSYSEYPDSVHNTIGVTTLIDSAQIHKLKLAYPGISTPSIERINLSIGTAVHMLFEKASRGFGTSEYRIGVRTHVGPHTVTISGQPDHIELEDGVMVLYDVKTTKAASAMYGIKPEWEMQTNIYKWMLGQKGLDIDVIRAVAIYKDWSVGDQRRMIQSDHSYPDEAIQIIDIPIWTYDKVVAFIKDRLEAHFLQENPQCSFEERWARKAVYAVHKGRKYRAERLLDSMDAAVEWCDNNDAMVSRVTSDRVRDERGYYIVARPEVWTRCESYCDVASVCPQFKEFNEAKRNST